MGTLELECPLCCGESFPDKCSLKYHLLLNATLSCPACLQRFTSILALAYHLDEHCGSECCPSPSPTGTVCHQNCRPTLSDRDPPLKPAAPAPNNLDVAGPVAATSDGHRSKIANATDELMEVNNSLFVDASEEMEVIQEWEDGNDYICVSCNCMIRGVIEHITKFHPDELEVVLQTVDVVTLMHDDVTNIHHPSEMGSATDELETLTSVTPTPSSATSAQATTNENSSPIVLVDCNDIVAADNSILPINPLGSKLPPEHTGLPSNAANSKNSNSPVLLKNSLSKRLIPNIESILPSQPRGVELSLQCIEPNPRVLLNTLPMKPTTSAVKTIGSNLLPSKPNASKLLSPHKVLSNIDIVVNTVLNKSSVNIVKPIDSNIGLPCKPLVSELLSEHRGVPSDDAKNKNTNSPIVLRNIVANRLVTNDANTAKSTSLQLGQIPQGSVLVSSDDDKNKKSTCQILVNSVLKNSTTNVVKQVGSVLPNEEHNIKSPQYRNLHAEHKSVSSDDDAINKNNLPRPTILNNCLSRKITINITKAVENVLPCVSIGVGSVVSDADNTLVDDLCSVGSNTSITETVEETVEDGPCEIPELKMYNEYSSLRNTSITETVEETVEDVPCEIPELKMYNEYSSLRNTSITETVEENVEDVPCEISELKMYNEYSSSSNGADENNIKGSPWCTDENVVTKVTTDFDKEINSYEIIKKRDKIIEKILKKHVVVDKSNVVDKRGMHYVRNIVKINKFWEPKSSRNLATTPDRVKTQDGSTEQANLSSSVMKPRKRQKVGLPTENDGKPKVREHTVQPGQTPSLLTALNELTKSGSLISIKPTGTHEVLAPKPKPTPSIYKMFGSPVSTDKDEHENTQQTSEDVEHGNTILSGYPSKARKSSIEPKIEKPRSKSKKGESTVMTLRKIIRGRKALFKDPLNPSEPGAERASSTLVCSNCQDEFPNYSRFSDHLCFQMGEDICSVCSCDVCGTECISPGDLQTHRGLHEPCMKRLDYAKRRERHCEICNMVSYSPKTFRLHYNAHVHDQQTGHSIDPLVGILKCKKCTLVFKTNEELKSHWSSHDEPSGPEATSVEIVYPEVVVDCIAEDDNCDYYTCETCGKRIPQGGREVHEQMHQGIQQVFCNICNKPFHLEADLAMHMVQHKKAETTLACFYCRLKFDNVYLLRAHVMGTHSVLDRPYSCSFCGRRFYKAMEKQRHEKIHTGEKNYRCGVCGARFRSSHCLTTHARRHSGVRPYECAHCGKSFRTLSGVTHHEEIHNDRRPYHCPHCPKDFKSIVHMRNHIRQHTKPFSCTCCGRCFSELGVWREHTKAHEKGTLKHACHVCGSSYGRDYALKDHMKSHEEYNLLPSPLLNEGGNANKRKTRKRKRKDSDADSDTNLVKQFNYNS